MLSWGSMVVRISIRGLDARERSVLSERNPAQRHCTLSLAARPGRDSWICIIDATGGYECPLVTSDGMPPLRNKNGTTDRRGVLKLDVPLAGTHATPPLAWQRRYPTRGRLHPAVDPRRHAAPGAELRPSRASAALSGSLFPRVAANRREGRAPLRLRRAVRSVLRARSRLEPSRRDRRLRLPRLDALQSLRDRPAFVTSNVPATGSASGDIPELAQRTMLTPELGFVGCDAWEASSSFSSS